MGSKSFAAVAGAGLLTVFALPLAYHSRDTHFFPEDHYSITQEADGKHLHVINTRMNEIADIRLVAGPEGRLVGQGIVMGDTFEVTVGEQEATFIHDHGAEKLWLGRDVVHVRPDTTAQADTTGPEPQF